ncbi:DinB family protein [Peribacillus tepidiphilus]|uniref:DinB family protein n=1 Tax=Peribacillus tepidiphilus TaxID=2652445 RepID=UPI0035B5204E
MQKRPEIGEFAPYYLSYVNLVPEGDILHILDEQIKLTIHLLQNISETQGQFRYAPDKWSIKEVIGHMADTERVMGYRLLCIARGDTVSLPGFNENAYVHNASFDQQSMQDLLQNLNAVRQSTLHLIKSLNQEAWLRRGIANNYEVTVLALATIMAGHELHHRQIIKERYMGSESYPLS